MLVRPQGDGPADNNAKKVNKVAILMTDGQFNTADDSVATTVIAYVAAQSVFVLIRLVSGETVNWFGVFFTLSLVILAGVAGGILGSQLQARGIVPSGQRTLREGDQ